MANGSVRVQSGDVISATLMNHILEQLEELTGGAPADLERLMQRIQDLEAWQSLSDPQISKVTGIDARLAAAETAVTSLAGLASRVTTLEQDLTPLQARVTALELAMQVSGKVRISGFDPATQVPVGQVLTILGTGFKTKLIDNLVFINDTPIYNFRVDSDDSRLKVIIPTNLPGVTPTASGAPITVRVANDDGEAQRPYLVVPALPVTGTPPRITSVQSYSNPQSPPVTGNPVWIYGEGFGSQSNQVTVSFIYKTPTGPVSRPIGTIISMSDGAILGNVPHFPEVPPNTNFFEAVVEVRRGNHVPALAKVNFAPPSQ